MKILLAVDGSSCADAAVAEVCRRPWPSRSEVLVVIVEPRIQPGLLSGRTHHTGAFDEIAAAQRAAAVNYLSNAAAILQQRVPDVGIVSKLLEGSPKDAIVDEAERWGADLIVVGSHGHGSVKRFVLGSVSLAVALNAPCSVEIVRARPATQPAES